MTEENKNLISSMHEEMNRCRELEKLYADIPAGSFGVAMTQRAIKNAEKSIEENDVVKMLIAYKELKEIEG